MQLRRIFRVESKDLSTRFDVPLGGPKGAPEVTIDYADGPLAVQVTSLPSTAKQAEHCEQEAQSKMFELDVARSQMGGNPFKPTLLFNADAMAHEASSETRSRAEAARARLVEFAKFKDIVVLDAATPSIAACLLDRAVA